MGTISRLQNPYIGPQPFKTGDPFYGRDWEILDLLDLLIAERIVLLYSPSGAGKTSLIQAGLFPKIQKKGFHTLPVMRVSLIPSPEQLPELPPECNRYVLSSLLSLEKELPEDAQTPIEELASITFAGYLDRRQSRGTPDFTSSQKESSSSARKRRVRLMLIFDQFEEILTIDPTDQAVKIKFFSQIGTALQQPDRWALFSMREEYAVGLEPYLRKLPTQLNTTFRLELLKEETARQAMQRPAQDADILFTDAAATRLFEDLCKVRVQQPSGSPIERQGLYVEPVQLQIVCHRLWEKLPVDTAEIGTVDIEAIKDVHNALADYYADCIASVAQKTGVRERMIREWFEHQLITEQGIRGQVLKGQNQSQDLDNQAIDLLVDVHLVRAEKRLNATWFELAHDRLIEPVRKNNEKWFQTNLSMLQRQADLWENQGQPNGLLLSEDALMEAEIWAAAHQLTPTEEKFLIKSQETRAIAEHRQKQTRRIRRLAVIATIISIIAIFALVVAYFQKREAERLGRVSLAQALAAQALSRQDDIGALLARQAYLFNSENQGHILAQVDHSLRTALNASSFKHTLGAHNEKVNTVAFSPDGQKLASGGMDKMVYLWELNTRGVKPTALDGHEYGVFSVTFSPDGKTLASGDDDATICLWDLQNLNAKPKKLEGHDNGISALAFSPNGKTLASGSDDTTIRVWDLQSLDANSIVLNGHEEGIPSLSFSPDGKTLVSGGDDRTVRLWDLQKLDIESTVLTGHDDKVFSVAISPDGKTLASGSDDKTIRLWDLKNPGAVPTVLHGHEEGILSIAFSPDGKTLVSSAYDSTVRLWALQESNPKPSILPVYGGQVFSVMFTAEGQILAPGALDSNVQLWDLQQFDASPILLSGHKDRVNTVAFAPDGRTLASGSGSEAGKDTTVRLWNLKDPRTALPALQGHDEMIEAIAFNPNKKILASASDDTTIRLWNLRNLDVPPIILKGSRGEVYSIAFSPDGNTLVSGGEDTAILSWDLQNTSQLPTTLGHHEDSIYSIAFSPDGKLLASGSTETIRLWSLKNPDANRFPPLNHGKPVFSIAFSPDGQILASGSTEGDLWLWNLKNPGSFTPLPGHTGTIFSVVFSSDGKTLASGSKDGTVRLWDMQNPGNSPIVLHGQKGTVLSLQFSPDGKTLASGNEDNTILIWPISTKDLAEKVCQKVWRNLTLGEWYQFLGPDIPYRRNCDNLPPGD